MAYTTIDDPSAYFQTKIYAGTGSAQSLTNDGNSNLKPDWIWFKNRSTTSAHSAIDSTRGVSVRLRVEATDAESSASGNFVSFDTDGFSISGSGSGYNTSSENFVAWQWKANGGTTTSQTGADINSVTQASTTAGFSIVTYTGDGNTSQTVKHGLGGVPEAILMKNRDRSSNWESYFAPVGNSYIMELSTNAAKQDTDNYGNTDPTSTVFTVDSGANNANASGEDIIAYCFRSIQGYSKIGSYTGNGDADGPFVYLGFKPAFVIIKASSRTGEWVMLTGKIATGTNSNPLTDALYAHTSAAETGTFTLDFLSNGFKIKHTSNATNGSDETYIYMAFAEHPFVSSKGVPVTAR